MQMVMISLLWGCGGLVIMPMVRMFIRYSSAKNIGDDQALLAPNGSATTPPNPS